MHLGFDLDKGRFGVRLSPYFDVSQDRCTLVLPGVFIHIFAACSFFMSCGTILAAFRLPGYSRCKKVWRTRREVLVKRVFLPHIEAIGMLPTASGGGYAGRPGPQVPGIANLYLAGDWIGAGFLSDPSMGSARQVAQLILQGNSFITTPETLVDLRR